jgi:hypothetical protein
VSTACSSHTWVPQKHGARQSHRCVNPSFSEHGYPHASPPVTEPAQGAPRAIRGHPPTKSVRPAQARSQPTSKRGREDAWGPTSENSRSDRAANPARTEAANTREAVCVCWQWCLPESVGGEACACKNSREGGVQPSVALASTVLLGYPSTKTARCGHLRALRANMRCDTCLGPIRVQRQDAIHGQSDEICSEARTPVR